MAATELPTALTVLAVALDRIAPDPGQPRTWIDPSGLETLAASIAAAGVIQPLLVSHHPDPAARRTTPYMIVSGERRWRAARLAGLAAVPVVVHAGELAAADRLMLQLDENDGELRRELSLYDRAAAVARALSLSGQRKDDFARRHQKSAAWVSHYLVIAGATGPTRDLLAAGLLTGITVARLFSRLSATDQRSLLDHARRTRVPITPRRIESFARRGGNSPGASRPRRSRDRFMLGSEDLAALLRLLGHPPQGSPKEQFQLLLALARAPARG
jgi:ParB family chromosome partitioning protein